jgi:chaperone BCS1
VFRRVRQSQDKHSTQEEVSISCFGRSPKVLRELLSECHSQYLKLIQDKTSVFEHRDGDWKRSIVRDIRPISTVILGKKVKGELLKDIREFLDPGARRWYSNRGIPYRRGYLLYGPPGTGKSSLSLSIAGYFDLDIYILSLSGIDEGDLITLFAELPRHCIILLEDIDAASPTRSQDTEIKGSGQSVTGSPPQKDKATQGMVSLSALLNVIDGVASQEGRVLIMTTNYIERLDKALIRPGRVDKKVEFRLADEEMITQLFCIVFKHSEGDVDHPRKLQSNALEEDKTVERLAREFTAKVPKLEFSPAEILSFLLEHKQSAGEAIDNVDVWITRMMEDRKTVKNKEKRFDVSSMVD